jgi:hypothetical protein
VYPPIRYGKNVFSHIPAALAHPYHGQITIYPVQPGDNIDSIARRMFEGGRYHSMLHSTKRAVLLHNNPVLEIHLTVKTLPKNMLVDVTPVRLSQMDQQFWKTQQTAIGNYLDQLDIRLLVYTKTVVRKM